jgi:hypothetical protein
VIQVKPVSAERYWFYLRILLLWLNDQDRGKDRSDPIAMEGQKTILECARRFFL